jgi:hypothetical protein
MSDDFRPMFLMLSGVVLFLGIKILYFPAIIIGGLGVLGFGIWLGISYYKVFKKVKKK